MHSSNKTTATTKTTDSSFFFYVQKTFSDCGTMTTPTTDSNSFVDVLQVLSCLSKATEIQKVELTELLAEKRSKYRDLIVSFCILTAFISPQVSCMVRSTVINDITIHNIKYQHL